MKSEELKQAGKEASDIMGRHVLDQIGGKSGYDYEQTGDFHKMLSTEARGGDIKQTPTKMTAGVFYIPEMNDGIEAKRNFQTQKHWIGSRMHGRYVTINLKQENQMPKWIIAEFGMGGLAEKTKMSKDFQITYTPRSGKPYMFGPSSDNVSDGNKHGYFMVGRKGLMGLLGNRAESNTSFRTHPGIRAGKIFSSGLKSSKEEVNQAIAEGIQKYLGR